MFAKVVCSGLFWSFVTASAQTSNAQTVRVPLFYEPNGNLGKAATNISWGTPAQHPVTTTFDTGSRGFWIDTQVSKLVDTDVFTGSQCVYQLSKYYPIYNYTASTSHSAIIKSPPQDSGFAYGNAKMIDCPTSLNDTMTWSSNGQSLRNQRVALAQNTTEEVQGANCTGPGYSTDVSILGVGPGSSWRANLLTSGLTKTLNWSLWFNSSSASAAPISTFHGEALIGSAPPPSAYAGDLTNVPIQNIDQGIFYAVNRPILHIGSKLIPPMSNAAKTMILDTGTITDMIPFHHKDLVAANVGLVYYTNKGGFIYLAYKGKCASIPKTLTLDYTFAGVKGENVTVKVPIRNYAIGPVPKKEKLCNLATLQVDNVGTSFFGVPFFTAATAYFQDEAKIVGLAQGGVA